MAFVYDLTDTWNAAGTAFNAIKMNVTDTASAAASRLVTCQVGGTDKFVVGKDGSGYFAGNVGFGVASPATAVDADGIIRARTSTAFIDMEHDGTNGSLRSTSALLLYAGTGTDFIVHTDGVRRIRVKDTGEVGIGEDGPDYKLDVNGSFGFTPGSSVTPADNGDVVFELTNNTTLTVKAKGSDGVVRSGTITLA